VAKDVSRLRSHAEQIYHLTDQFQAQLQVLESARVPIAVQISPGADTDIEPLVLIVMMAAAQSAREDLKALLEQMKAVNAAKEALRREVDKDASHHGGLDFDSTFQLIATVYSKQLERDADEVLRNLDSAGDLSQLDSLRLQMMMDRLSKVMSTLSNILKKMSDTSSQIVQNLK
jgi:hypothetical protein